MRYISIIIIFVFLFMFALSSFAQIKMTNQLNTFSESIEKFNRSTENKEHHIPYDSTALDSFIRSKMNQYHIPGLQTCIVKNEHIIWNKSYGYANLAQHRLVTDSTLFFLASLSKPVWATELLQLWENGLFNLDDDINNYLPFQVLNHYHSSVPITFRMLLTHTSSIKDDYWGTLDPLFVFGNDSPIALDSFLVNYLVPGGSFYNTWNYDWRSPGTNWDYTNVGAALGGYLVESISSISLEQYCQDSIFVPLGMYETSWFLANLNQNHIAMPYYYSRNRHYPYGHSGQPHYPAGQLRSSAIQYSYFLSMNIQKGQYKGKRILNGSTIDLITTIQDSTINPSQGLIWFIIPFNIPNVGTRNVCYHGGSSHGARNLMGYVLGSDENVGAITLTNSESDNGTLEIQAELLAYGILNTVGAIEKENRLPTNFILRQNYPNPFNPKTTIEFSIPKSDFVTLKIYNILGEEVATLVSEKLAAGKYKYNWDAGSLASGVYAYRIQVGEFQQIKKMILIK